MKHSLGHPPPFSPSLSEIERILPLSFRSLRQNKYLATEGNSFPSWRSAHVSWFLIQWTILFPLTLLIIFHLSPPETAISSTSCCTLKTISKLRCTQSTRSCYTIVLLNNITLKIEPSQFKHIPDC